MNLLMNTQQQHASQGRGKPISTSHDAASAAAAAASAASASGTASAAAASAAAAGDSSALDVSNQSRASEKFPYVSAARCLLPAQMRADADMPHASGQSAAPVWTNHSTSHTSPLQQFALIPQALPPLLLPPATPQPPPRLRPPPVSVRPAGPPPLRALLLVPAAALPHLPLPQVCMQQTVD